MRDGFSDESVLLDFKLAAHSAMIRSMLRKRFRGLAESSGLKIGELQLLMLLSTAHTDTAGEIARHLGVSRSLVSQTVDGLVRQGYLETAPDKTDRRLVRLRLTERAEPLLETFERMKQEFFSATLEGISSEELEIFFSVLQRIWGNMERMGAEEKGEGGVEPQGKED